MASWVFSVCGGNDRPHERCVFFGFELLIVRTVFYFEVLSVRMAIF